MTVKQRKIRSNERLTVYNLNIHYKIGQCFDNDYTG